MADEKLIEEAAKAMCAMVSTVGWDHLYEGRREEYRAMARTVLEMRDRGHEALRLLRESAAALTPAAPETPTHDYLSTACYHGLCERCRKQCKFCSVSCRCVCHAPETPTEPQIGTCDFSDVLHDLRDCKAAWHRNWKPQTAQPLAGGQLVQQRRVVDRMVMAKQECEDDGKADWSERGMVAALAIAREEWVALPDVEKAIIQLYCFAHGNGISAAEFAKNVLKRLKPEPAKQEPTLREQIATILDKHYTPCATNMDAADEIATGIEKQLTDGGSIGIGRD